MLQTNNISALVAEVKRLVSNDRGSTLKKDMRTGIDYYEGKHDIANYRLFYFYNEGEIVEEKNIDKLSTDIKSLQTAIFHGDESKEMKMALYDFVAKISLDIRPEDIADKKLKGEEIVDDEPYPGYDKDKMTFLGDE